MYDDDLIFCPNCFEKSAVLMTVDFRGEVACCGECHYMWKELIESSDINDETSDLEYIGDNENIFDIHSTNIKRYNNIIKFSNLHINKELTSDEQRNVTKKQEKYFKNKSIEKYEYEKIDIIKTLKNFIENPKKEDINSVFYVLEFNCGVPGFNFDTKNYQEVKKVSYKQFNVNALKMYNINIEDIINSLNKLNYEVIFFDNLKSYTEEELNVLKDKEEIKSTGFNLNEIEKIQNLLKETEIKTDICDVVSNDKLLENKEFDDFLNKKTTYGCTVEKLFDLIEDCNPISSLVTSKPFIIELNKYLDGYMDYFITLPALIDYDNKIVFLHISHKSLIETLVEEFYEEEKEIYFGFDEIEALFHKKINCSQIYVNSRNRDEKQDLMITNSFKTNILKDKYFNVLKKNNIKYSQINVKTDIDEDIVEDYFVVLNKVNDLVEGEVYFPKENEENIPEGKILIIPTATEEYFLSSLSNTNGKGCIITEKGSKTSHIILMSKEFNFNVILINDAISKFKDGDNLKIDLNDLIIYNIN